MDSRGLSISIVVYRPHVTLLNETLASISAAYEELRRMRNDIPLAIYLVDNGGLREHDVGDSLRLLTQSGATCRLLRGHGNVGYGRGHNLVIDTTDSRYHLILNPDIDMDRDALVRAFEFFDANPIVGLITPRIDDDQQGIQYLCRRYPTVFDLFVRGFLPGRFQRCFRSRLGHYEMRDVINERDVLWDPPIVSGCFMMFRADLLRRLSGFDPRYFLYFEDYDLSMRAHEVTRIAYVPSVRAFHHGGGAARKGSAHIRMFAASAIKFFNRFGWKWL
ncbi:glycosyltransferase family 2 protein [Paraburkholderia sp. SIMBA_049]